MTKKQRNISLLVIAGVLLIVAFFTNPNQAHHLKSIRETGALRQSGDKVVEEALLPFFEYQNYFVFSVTRWNGKTMSYGYFGIVQTTNHIGVLYGDPSS